MALSHSSLPPVFRAPSRASQFRAARRTEAARRQQVLDRLQVEHPDWTGQQILFAALLELHQDADWEFLRQVSDCVAEWSQGQNLSLNRPPH